MNSLGQTDKDRGLLAVAEALSYRQDEILAANEEDVKQAHMNGMKESLIDRLRLTKERIGGMANGLRQVAALKDPIGEMVSMENHPNGLKIIKQRVPLGVIGIIYESRPNVTSDAFGLCFKAGNACILRGGSDAIHSNVAIVKVIRDALASVNITTNGNRPGSAKDMQNEGQTTLPKDAVQLVEDTSREVATELMRLDEYIDVLIPRGGAGLIRSVMKNSTIPVIETGVGNCHVYVDESADFDMALAIIVNAKTQRLGVCNACESLVVHSGIADAFVPRLYDVLNGHGVEIRGDETAVGICPMISHATEEDYYTEYLDKIISLKIVSDINMAIAHVNKYNTKHSETIITSDYDNAFRFTNEIDAAAVYVNASTRFTDGEVFGLGAEIGISTQKLHARGPMGLVELTSIKYVVFGSGQIRE